MAGGRKAISAPPVHRGGPARRRRTNGAAAGSGVPGGTDSDGNPAQRAQSRG